MINWNHGEGHEQRPARFDAEAKSRIAQATLFLE
jgi:hypothetical protein